MTYKMFTQIQTTNLTPTTRDEKISSLLQKNGNVDFNSYKDLVIFEKERSDEG
jgi:hypothetical protein